MAVIGGKREQLFQVCREYQGAVAALGLNAPSVFTHPQIIPWRSLSDRQNCTLDAVLEDGCKIRWHIKRYPPSGGGSPAQREAEGIELLQGAHIPTVPLVAWGNLSDGRSFIILDDLGGYQAADKLIQGGADFRKFSDSLAELSAKLHQANLHHRDLYLCHFFVRPGDTDIRLIDAARVRILPPWPFRRRWIVKDLAQFWYSSQRLDISPQQREDWLARYAQQRGIANVKSLQAAVMRKAAWIARHDKKLRHSQPNRNISIPRPQGEVTR